jgi:type II secretion system (T2SS) protein E
MSTAASDDRLDTRAQSVAGFPEGAQGVTPPTNVRGAAAFLSDVILDLGFADDETVERAIEAARQPGRRVDQILLETGAVTEEELARALAERYGLDHVDLDRFEVDMSAARLISRSAALRYRAVPIAFAADRSLIVAVADPVDALAIDDIEVMTKTEARQAVASGAAIEALADQLPEVGTPPQSRNGHQTLDTATPPNPTEPAPSVDPDVREPEIATEPTQADAAPPEEDRTAHREPVPDEDSARREAEARNAALEAELAEANDVLRELAKTHDALREQADQLETERDALRDQAGQTEADRERAREQLAAATRERDQLREALDQVAQERDQLSEVLEQGTGDRDRLREALEQVTEERDRLDVEAQHRSVQLASLQEQARSAESRVEEATARIEELEDADRRAEAARLALSEQRKESEREREQSSRLERKLRDELTAAEQRHGALERHLSGFINAAERAKAMAEELIAPDGAITDDDTESESDGTSPARSAEAESSRPVGAGGESGSAAEPEDDDAPPSSIQKPTI